jgi:sigma-B regulation protein RsbU (phosphoserine phosphatase)
MPLGIIEETSWEQGVITFKGGDVLVAYTDGVTEAQNETEEFYNDARLLAAAQANLGHPAEMMQARLVKDIQDFVEVAPQFDDMTLMIVKKL